MMRATLKTFVLFGIACLLALPTATAQDGGGDAVSAKVGVVNVQLLLRDYDKRQQKYKELQVEVDNLQTYIDELSEKIEGMKDAFEKDSPTLSPEEQRERKNAITDAFGEYESEMKSRQRTIDNQEEAVLQEVFTDIEDMISKVAAEKGYHLILNLSAGKGPQGSVVYHADSVNITSAVLAALNAQ